MNSLVEYQIGICTSLVGSDLATAHSKVVVVVLLLLASKALLFQILKRELFDYCIVELEPLAVILRILVSLFYKTVIVACVCSARVHKNTH